MTIGNLTFNSVTEGVVSMFIYAFIAVGSTFIIESVIFHAYQSWKRQNLNYNCKEKFLIGTSLLIGAFVLQKISGCPVSYEFLKIPITLITVATIPQPFIIAPIVSKRKKKNKENSLLVKPEAEKRRHKGIKADTDKVTKEELEILQVFAGEILAYDEGPAREVLLVDYLRLYCELNEKSVISVYNERTGNLLFCDRIDYLNVDRKNGCMTPLANCKIDYFMEPDSLFLNIPEEIEEILMRYYRGFGAERYMEK